MHSVFPTVSIIMPNWNGLDHLEDSLRSLAQQTLRPLETIMVDNGSTDRSVEFVQRRYPWVSIIQLDHNTGFAVAVNRGILAAKGEFLALLNNDTELSPTWLEVLVTALAERKELGSVAGKMLNFFDRSFIDGAGDGITIAGSPYTRGYAEPDDGRFSSREYVFGVCAGAALIRREVFDRVGMFDEDFISYFEDVDLAFRAQLAGYKSLYVPEAICYHKRGAPGNALATYPVRMQERNLTAYYIKDYPLMLLLTKTPLIVASRVRRIYRLMRAGMGRAMWHGFVEGLARIPRMLVKRREVQKRRTVPLSYMKSFMRRRL